MPGTVQFKNSNDIGHTRDFPVVWPTGSINTKSKLLAEVAQVLSFPSWFGHNWDALLDCLRDLSWFETDGITLAHEKGFDLPEDIASVYLTILFHAVDFWQTSSHENGFHFNVVFDPGDRGKIESLLNQEGRTLLASCMPN